MLSVHFDKVTKIRFALHGLASGRLDSVCFLGKEGWSLQQMPDVMGYKIKDECLFKKIFLMNL